MKYVMMMLISRRGKVINQWNVSHDRYKDALEHAMERAQREGHAGVVYAEVNDNKITDVYFESLDFITTLAVIDRLQPMAQEIRITPKSEVSPCTKRYQQN